MLYETATMAEQELIVKAELLSPTEDIDVAFNFHHKVIIPFMNAGVTTQICENV